MLKNISLQNIVITLVAAVIAFILLFEINSAGKRTVVQYPTGYLKVKFEPGIFFTALGSQETYMDVITFDFDKDEANQDATVEKMGIPVFYRDGGKGTIYGIARFQLTNDYNEMIKTHKEFKSLERIANKAIVPTVEEIANLTAGLLTSEEAYAEKRGIFKQYMKDQIENGAYTTKIKEKTRTDADGTIVTENIPIINTDEETKKPIRSSNDLAKYGIKLISFQITDWSFEKKTMEQIDEKRAATMAIITSKANAEKAIQSAITAEQQGLANVMEARYEREVEKAKAIVKAEEIKAVRVIEAEQKVEVAEQDKLEQEQKKLAALEYEQAQKAKGRGDAAYKKMVMEADGALAQKLEVFQAVHNRYADNLGKQKWVPDVMIGASVDGNGASSAAALVEMLTAKTAKELSLDMSMPNN